MDYEVLTYGESRRGRSHEKNGKPLQDSSYHGLLKDNPEISLLIVADGVGSAPHAEDGSRIAVEESRKFLENQKTIGKEQIQSAYREAFIAIKKYAKEEENDLSDYDTTLSIAVFNSETGAIVYGHSGDGAIIAIRKDGINECITTPQKGSDATSVIPLRDTTAWVFDEKKGPYVAVMAMTDGVLDILMPGILRMTDEPIYVRLTSWLADIKFYEDGKDWEEQFKQRLDYIFSDVHKGNTNDDLTLIVAINVKEKADYRSDEYYKEPDWEQLKKDWHRLAYPSLYEKKESAVGEQEAEADAEKKSKKTQSESEIEKLIKIAKKCGNKERVKE